MKKALTPLLFLLLIQRAFAQDSIPVSFHQETDTLVKQRFIDRYENVFMTKVPTRQMFKIAAVSSEIQGTGVVLGYEYKLFPSLSVEASVYAQLSRYNVSIVRDLIISQHKKVNIWANAKVRWYYNMNNRMREGLNANNFSGAYLAISYDQQLHLPDMSGGKRQGWPGLLYGFQSRFLNNGFFDFSLGVYHKDIGNNPYFQSSPAIFGIKNYVLGSQARIGIALGDWKKSGKNPLCDVIVCDEIVHNQLKIEMPNMAIGIGKQTINAGLAYEKKLGNSPVSVQANTNFFLYNQSGQDSYKISFLAASAGLELRYYFLQRFLIRNGKTGGNLSGPYTALKGGYDFSRFKRRYPFDGQVTLQKSFHELNTAVVLGYQQRLFKRIYIDGSVFYNKPFLITAPFSEGSPFPYSYRTFGTARPYIMSKLAIGFTI
ncbi:hypothetical protein [Dyadobacter psychrophilus]|uniref:Uncharacterized protein n=1 Tax=Dyadobacter psychrophilus TaxID=651661 RepID=A0A1T5G670_9BACT|nr:hypothetical protein [Dyadobacter psychrophilus]SKC03993.1 hypothetical protein SAMN05660293_03728 [Dyadobacter psychrophilus]